SIFHSESTTMSYPLSQMLPKYEQAFAQCSVQAASEGPVKIVAERMVALRPHYEAVEKVTGIPWWFAGILHYKEWEQKEPELFTQKVAQVLMEKNYHRAKTRTLEAYLWGLDLWNGFKSGVGAESEWVWAGTNILKSPSEKIGAAALIRYLGDEGTIDIPGSGSGQQLVVMSNTVFKAKLAQSSSLKATEKLGVEAGTRLVILSDELAEEDHVKVVIPDGVLQGQSDRLEWYVYKGHIKILGTEPDNKPQDEPEAPTVSIASVDRGNPIQVPKLGTVYLGDPIIEGGHFSWAEATKNGSRIPADETVVDGILRIAKVMEEVREFVGNKPITVNSWYRDPASNRAAGGASQSRHLVGDAVDFVVSGISPPQVNRQLEPWWGDRGGLASASCFTHIDARGYKARWSYGF
ncbi:MAG: D-Ala-D-Ala carboxypeptidase family metallohydrolase, partial [Leptolyngbyaceae bacterium]|nr:D-Ala-D-Ala carboxypeptidase family metallohydrolase [Leptolyngbyaceae bacterium]